MSVRHRWLVLVLLSALSACASTAGRWSATENTYAMDRDELEFLVTESLSGAGWEDIPRGRGFDQLWFRSGSGGHRTHLGVSFEEQPGGSGFTLLAKSGHAVNWLTLGLLGLFSKGSSRDLVNAWLDEWRAIHSPLGPAPVP